MAAVEAEPSQGASLSRRRRRWSECGNHGRTIMMPPAATGRRSRGSSAWRRAARGQWRRARRRKRARAHGGRARARRGGGAPAASGTPAASGRRWQLARVQGEEWRVCVQGVGPGRVAPMSHDLFAESHQEQALDKGLLFFKCAAIWFNCTEKIKKVFAESNARQTAVSLIATWTGLSAKVARWQLHLQILFFF